ncbi:hypothetical protein [Oxalicibacterium faecigallinarum]|uniref:DUF4410 domain-containing protein n=1 Tax=Oxalicibacterium faecigallinarum TaxID=573741 RepID=A0A8J3F544_9BURK|nr:hypothetical protein [Oxalicibacterium faecigallinarum]GGI17496.1 hypothetical protein GCM10008066_09270 [Oxalicibacterium faecigallinarum]
MKMLGLPLTLFLLTGCAATVNNTSSSAPAIKTSAASAKNITLNLSGDKQHTAGGDWEKLKAAWQYGMKTAASGIGAGYSEQEGKPRATGQDGTVIAVQIKDYRYIGTGTRYGLGAFSGNAFVDANVKFINARTGALLGERNYNTTSSAWQGIFSPMTDKQVEALSNEIVKEVQSK